MRLYIGKNYAGEAAPVQSVFRLGGNDEDALTSALGFLLARDREFCAGVVRLLGVARRKPVAADYRVHLQEVTGSRFGRRDVVIEYGDVRIVLEAKIGGAEPTPDQLLKYGAEDNVWRQFKTRAIVALTQVEMAAKTRREVEDELRKRGITFKAKRWHDIIDLALRHSPSDGSDISRYLFQEFDRFIRSEYALNYYDAEVYIQDLNPLNAKIFEKGWAYVGGDKRAPLYFAPYFTNKCDNPGLSRISRVLEIVVGRPNDIEEIPPPPSDGHRSHWEEGLRRIRCRAKKEGRAQKEPWGDKEQRLYFFDCPITKKALKDANREKQLPNQIPPGFSLRFDELLGFDLAPKQP